MYKIFLLGGVGNNLFQITRALTLMESGKDVRLLKISKKFVPIYKLICKHKIHGDWLKLEKFTSELNLEIKETSFIDIFRLALIFFHKKLGFTHRFDMSLDKISNEKLLFSRSLIDVGYFQSKRHVSVASIIKTSTILKNILNIDSIRMEKFVLHLRGGDFSIATRISDTDLRKAALESIDQRLDFEIVTDDPKYAEHCTDNLNIKAKIISNDPYNDFLSMCSANNLYLSNSTFSFWAGNVAKLNGAAKVYLPDNWSYSFTSEAFKLETR